MQSSESDIVDAFPVELDLHIRTQEEMMQGTHRYRKRSCCCCSEKVHFLFLFCFQLVLYLQQNEELFTSVVIDAFR